MSRRPILFSDPMVRAILDGTKTQTRRIVKPQPATGDDIEAGSLVWLAGELCKVRESRGRNKRDAGELVARPYSCPYGEPGDTLYVRETWGAPSADVPGCPGGRKPQEGDRIVYRANLADAYQWTGTIPWRPSIHMPRWASRIELKVAAVRVEPLQEITEAEAEAEGVAAVCMADVPRQGTWTNRQDFAQLWDTINGKRGPWESNPLVWVVEFEPVEASP